MRKSVHCVKADLALRADKEWVVQIGAIVSPKLAVSVPQFKKTILPTLILIWILGFDLIFLFCYGEEPLWEWVLTVDHYILVIRGEILILRASFGVTEHRDYSYKAFLSKDVVADKAKVLKLLLIN